MNDPKTYVSIILYSYVLSSVLVRWTLFNLGDWENWQTLVRETYQEKTHRSTFQIFRA
jgi:hypothetical protein